MRWWALVVTGLDGLPFDGGATLTGRALQQVAERGFGSAPRTGLDRPRQAVVLMTEARSQDEVAGPAGFARARELLLLGVGSEDVRPELEMITGGLERVLTYTSPQDLFNQIPKLQGKLCSRPHPGRDHPYTRASCGPASPDLGASRPVVEPSTFW